MTEQQARSKVVSAATAWYGANEADGSHKAIIDLYNAQKPLPSGYKVKYTDAWCATFVSAVFIKAGLASIHYAECSCSRMIDLYKKAGCWQEDDTYTPAVGDIIMYDWNDTGAGDCTGTPDHVGIVSSVSGRTMKVIEGNKSNAVGYRTMTVGARYIRGYCLPDYAKAAGTTATASQTAPTLSYYTKVTVTLPQLENGYTGASVTALQQLLTAKGYNCKGIDGKIGSNTVAALKAYQRANGLTVDGICGKNTWTALLTK